MTVRVKGDEWEPEHDNALRAFLEQGLTFGEIHPRLCAMFKGKRWTRNAVIGRAHRRGMVSQNAKGGKVGQGRPPKDKAKREPKSTKPIVFESAILREDSDMGALPRGRGRRAKPEEVEVRRKGHLPSIIEQSPVTSRPVVECGSKRCMWPTSDDVRCMEVCGVKATVGAYCDRHAQLAYRVMPSRSRNRTYHKNNVEYKNVGLGACKIDDGQADGQWIADHILDDVVTIDCDNDEALLIPMFLEKLA